MYKIIILLVGIFVPILGFGASDSIPSSLKKALDRYAAEHPSNVAIKIVNVRNAKSLYQFNADVPMNPASTMKLVTTKAALDILGSGYRWFTDVMITGKIENKTLTGDIYFVGNGDPSLDIRRFEELISAIKKRGISNVNGSIYVDRSSFLLPQHDSSLFDAKPIRPYNAGADAMLINENLFTLDFIPNVQDDSVSITSSPSAPKIQNKLKLSKGRCKTWPKTPTMKDGVIIFEGSYSKSCGEKRRQYSFFPSHDYFSHVFNKLWYDRIPSTIPPIRAAKTPASARLLYRATSEPLSSAIHRANKFSSNVVARQIFLTLSTPENELASIERSRKMLSRWLRDKNIIDEGFFIDNGSGLSRNSRLTASLLSHVLRWGWRDPSMPEFLSSLSVPGVDGTLQKRFSGDPILGRAHLKTGFLDGVRSIAGYLHLHNGETLSLVIIMSGDKLSKNRNNIESLVSLIYNAPWRIE